jgi:hypothetical protein
MLRIIFVFVALSIWAAPMGAAHTYLDRTSTLKGPIAYADATLKTVFYVESDGRHISAITFDGQVLWTRNPFVDAKLEPYRFAEPQIVRIGPSKGLGPSGWKPDAKATYVGIVFNSTQFGIVNTATGDFAYGGRD